MRIKHYSGYGCVNAKTIEPLGFVAVASESRIPLL